MDKHPQDGETLDWPELHDAEHASSRPARDIIDTALGLAAFALTDDENF